MIAFNSVQYISFKHNATQFPEFTNKQTNEIHFCEIILKIFLRLTPNVRNLNVKPTTFIQNVCL